MECQIPLCQQQDFPLVIKNAISDWKILSYTKEDWCNVFEDKLLKFRQGKKTYTEAPYWEHLCESKEITLRRFFELSTQDPDHWLYFDYKYVKDVIPKNETFIYEFKWAETGLLDLHEEDSALWIGNAGAHTPCHKDTYGCNLVAQLFGRKLWILLPPEETDNLKAVRVPYEESSVYSFFNFYMPNESLLSIKQAYKVVLSPGDLLYVPRHWWHYVENLEPSISINVWIPLDEDHESRLEESLVQYYISNICQDLTEEEAKQILNPNEYHLISNPCTLDLLEKCLENYKTELQNNENGPNAPNKGIEIKNKFRGDILQVDKLCMASYIKEKTEMNNLSLPTRKEPRIVPNDKVYIAQTLINSYCRQANLNSIKKALLQR